MRLSITTLNTFYLSPLGRISSRLIRQALRPHRPTDPGATVLGIGYSFPYLPQVPAPDASHHSRSTPHTHLRTLGHCVTVQGTTAMLPCQNLSSQNQSGILIGDELALPFPDESIDHICFVHGLEIATDPERSLREIWRILTPHGSATIVTPNRNSLWAHGKATPFSLGTPLGGNALHALLRQAMLHPVVSSTVLAFPPLNSPALIRRAVTFERIRARLAPQVGGILIVTAEKHLHQPILPPWKAGFRILSPDIRIVHPACPPANTSY